MAALLAGACVCLGINSNPTLAITASVRSDRQIQFLLHQTHEHWGTKRL